MKYKEIEEQVKAMKPHTKKQLPLGDLLSNKELDAIMHFITSQISQAEEAMLDKINFVTHLKTPRVQSLSQDQISITENTISFGRHKPPFERVVIEYDTDRYLIRFHEASQEEYGISYKIGKNKGNNSYGFRARPFVGILPLGYYFRVSGNTYKLKYITTERNRIKAGKE